MSYILYIYVLVNLKLCFGGGCHEKPIRSVQKLSGRRCELQEQDAGISFQPDQLGLEHPGENNRKLWVWP